MYLVGFLLLATPVVFVALLALAIDVTARKSRERKAVDEVVQTRLTDGNLGDVGELSCEKQRQGSNVVRVCVVLGGLRLVLLTLREAGACACGE